MLKSSKVFRCCCVSFPHSYPQNLGIKFVGWLDLKPACCTSPINILGGYAPGLFLAKQLMIMRTIWNQRVGVVLAADRAGVKTSNVVYRSGFFHYDVNLDTAVLNIALQAHITMTRSPIRVAETLGEGRRRYSFKAIDLH